MKNPNHNERSFQFNPDWSLINIAFANQTPYKWSRRDMVDKCGISLYWSPNTQMWIITPPQTPLSQLEWSIIDRIRHVFLIITRTKTPPWNSCDSNAQLNHFWSNSNFHSSLLWLGFLSMVPPLMNETRKDRSSAPENVYFVINVCKCQWSRSYLKPNKTVWICVRPTFRIQQTDCSNNVFRIRSTVYHCNRWKFHLMRPITVFTK
jgi:hypothetical protein